MASGSVPDVPIAHPAKRPKQEQRGRQTSVAMPVLRKRCGEVGLLETGEAAPEDIDTETEAIVKDIAKGSDEARVQSFFKLKLQKDSADPRRVMEIGIAALVGELRDLPTLPAEPNNARKPWQDATRRDMAVELPCKHCAFQNCTAEYTCDADLLEHVYDTYFSKFAALLEHIVVPEGDVDSQRPKICAVGSLYNEVVATAVRQGAPLAGLSIDRRALYNYTSAFAEKSVSSLICWCCARKFPYLDKRRVNDIRWTQPLKRNSGCEQQPWTFSGMNVMKAVDIFGLQTFLDRYGTERGQERINRARAKECRDDWCLAVRTPEASFEFICCPEDHTCKDAVCTRRQRCCPDCWLPICRECESGFVDESGKAAMPPASLANDMMIYYAPKVLYTEEVTVMEMICASVCLTSMICFSLEKKYRGDRAFDEKVHMNNHRMGARGNATSFPLPWQDLLLQLKQSDESNQQNAASDLPRSPEELSDFVSVLLKTSDEGDGEKQEALLRFVHQAIVRRRVVIRLITELHRSGHKAYRHVDLRAMEAKANMTLPENGVPPSVAKLLPYDMHLDTIRVQKQATPVSPHTTLEGVKKEFEYAKPNGVVLEKSGSDEGDINAQRIAAVRHFASKLGASVEADCELDQTSDSDGGEDKQQKSKKINKIAGGGRYMSEKGAAKVVDEYGKRRKVQRIACATGNSMIDQFEPWYFGIAFAFLFKYCTGMPDMPAFAKQPRHRRPPEAPRIEPGLWVRVMARRVEAQLSRDWSFGFVTWNYLFRSAVNLSRTIYTYDKVAKGPDTPKVLTPEDLEKGAVQIMKALYGSYSDMNGKPQKVNGDMTKVRYVPNLSCAAQRLLQNIEHTTRRLPGTQETRRLMRFEAV